MKLTGKLVTVKPSKRKPMTLNEKLTRLNMIWAGDISRQSIKTVLAEILGVSPQQLLREQRKRDARGAVSFISIV